MGRAGRQVIARVLAGDQEEEQRVRPIIIGAGRGSRLKALTDREPKSYASVGDRRIPDWLLESLAGAGMDTPVFIGPR